MKRPNSMRHLDDAIRRLCGGAPQDFVRARTVMANAIVASMLPDGVVKGGSALKMRFGEENTRFTTDLDTATATDPAAYAAQLDSRLRSGWEGFSGRVVERDPASLMGFPSSTSCSRMTSSWTTSGSPGARCRSRSDTTR